MNFGKDMEEDLSIHQRGHQEPQEEVQQLCELIKIHYPREGMDYDQENEEHRQIVYPIDRDVDFRRGG